MNPFQDKLILLKESNNTNFAFQQAAQVTKKTPFSSLIEKAKTAAKEKSERIQPVHTPSVTKLLDGPVYALAPITQLAPAFVKSCLIKSSNQIYCWLLFVDVICYSNKISFVIPIKLISLTILIWNDMHILSQFQKYEIYKFELILC